MSTDEQTKQVKIKINTRAGDMCVATARTDMGTDYHLP